LVELELKRVVVPKANLRRRMLIDALLVLRCGSALVPQSGATAQTAELKFLSAIRSQAEFDQLARVYTDSSYALHVLFVIDRKENDKIYYVNTQQNRFH
jgi:hypothetical protein